MRFCFSGSCAPVPVVIPLLPTVNMTVFFFFFLLLFSSLIFQNVLMELILFTSETFAIRALMENWDLRFLCVGSSDSELTGQEKN